MGEVLQINMLGEFSLSYGKNGINDQSNRSKKLWSLLAYLLAFRSREVSQSELIELLWPEDDTVNAANTLKTLLHRVRSLLEELGLEDGRQVITYRSGTYAWSAEIPCRVDTEEFEALVHQAADAYNSDELRCSLMLQAAALYKGDFLPKTASDFWVVPLSSYYHAQYVKLVHATVGLLEKQNRQNDIVDLCLRATVIDPYEESLHLALIRALVVCGREQQALAHYTYVTQLFFSKFGISPSAELVALYKDIMKTIKATELDLSIIRKDLRENEKSDGCFFCEYAFFKSVYQLEARSIARTGRSVFLGLVTVLDANNKQPPQKVLNRTVDRLYHTILATLRQGDIFTRYSVNQYLILLPSISYENGDMVMHRLQRSFRQENPKAPIVLHYTLQPLIPLDMEDENEAKF